MISSQGKKVIYIILSFVIITLFWELIVNIKNNEIVFPSIVEIFKSFKDIINIKSILLILKLIGIVLLISLISLLISLIFVPINSSFKFGDAFSKVLLSIMKSIPFLILCVYLFVVYFDNRKIIPLIISFMTIFPIVFEGFGNSYKSYPSILKDDMKLIKGNLFHKYIYGIMPLTIKDILTTFLQSVGLGIKVMIMSEYLAGVNGSIGSMIQGYIQAVEYNKVLAWVVIIIVITLIIDLIINKLIKLLNKIIEA